MKKTFSSLAIGALTAASLLPGLAFAAPAIPSQDSPPPAGCTEQTIVTIAAGNIIVQSATGAVLHFQSGVEKLSKNITVVAPAGQEIHRLLGFGIGGYAITGIVRKADNTVVDGNAVHFRSQSTGNPVHSRMYFDGKQAKSIMIIGNLGTRYYNAFPGQAILQATFCPTDTPVNGIVGLNSVSHPIIAPYDKPVGCTDHFIFGSLAPLVTQVKDIDGNVIFETTQPKMPQNVTVQIPDGYRLYATDYFNANGKPWFGAILRRANNSVLDVASFNDIFGHRSRTYVTYDDDAPMSVTITKGWPIDQTPGHAQYFVVTLCPDAPAEVDA